MLLSVGNVYVHSLSITNHIRVPFCRCGLQLCNCMVMMLTHVHALVSTLILQYTMWNIHNTCTTSATHVVCPFEMRV